MARAPAKPIDAKASEDSPDGPPRNLLERVQRWTKGGRNRSLIVGVALVLVTVGTIGTWLVLASLAAPPVPITIDDALAALDEGDLDRAGLLVERMQEQQTLTTSEYGGPLFVLGAIKTHEADQQWSAERRRADYLVASRYLKEARDLGVPESRREQGDYLLGQALVESDQLAEGAIVLEDALDAGSPFETDIHRLLAEAHYFEHDPDYSEVMNHLDRVVQSEGFDTLPPAQQTQVLLRRARTLGRLGRYDQAFDALTQLPPTADAADRLLIEGELKLRQAVNKLADKEGLAEARQLLDEAEERLQRAEQEDKLTRLTGAAKFFSGQIERLRDRPSEALIDFIEVRRNYGYTSEGIAASIAEGEVQQSLDDDDEALEAFRRALESIEDPVGYRSELMTISSIRTSVVEAHAEFLRDHRFDAAIALVDQLEPLFSEANKLEMRVATHEAWGDYLLDQNGIQGRASPKQRSKALAQYRRAGVAQERLTKLKFATREYSTSLWKAADLFYRGQSFSSAIRLLNTFLTNEPEALNAQALLRLGQCHFAIGELDQAIAAFEEGIEFHPEDAASYASRLGAAEAHQNRGEPERAEELLKQNLVGSKLTPRSPEWRDSLFTLGRLLYDVGRYDEAINRLEEAIARYPQATEQREAQYLVAESYRNAAYRPLERLATAKTVNEREKNKKLARSYLVEALKNYEAVQKEITLSGQSDELSKAMLRNCYMLMGSTLFDLERYNDAVKAYSNVSTLYQDEPFVMETLVQISHCWRRLNDPLKARGAIKQAQLIFSRLPEDTDFLATTTMERNKWQTMLAEMASW